MPAPKTLTAEDILSPEIYADQRQTLRRRIVALKKPRRIALGPDATFYFENYETMRQQIQEMLYIEGGGEAQLADELEAYNPMIPQGDELTATLMFEIDDAERRKITLYRLTNVELTVYIEVDGVKTYATPEQDVERTTADGKTSSVHFLHFHFTPELIKKFHDVDSEIVLGIEHENYPHMTRLSPASKASLGDDFDK